MARPKVLVVDDHDGTLQAIAEALRRDFSVWIARTPSQASAVATELEWDADVLVVDLYLGDGSRGDEFAAHYRTRQKRHTPVIVISGAPDIFEVDDRISDALILLKPFDFDELVRTVWRLIKR